MSDILIMKGNEALAEAAIRAGCQAYFGYPITPQSEILEYLADEGRKRGMIVLQAESEVAAINMVYGGAGAGARVMTSSSSPGVSLMQEGISYIACAELPCLLVNVNRGGPGLGTIQPSQGDYFQSVKGGGHGDYHLIVLAPASVQEMAAFVFDAFDLADRYRTPVMILADGALGQMMEKVEFPPYDQNAWVRAHGYANRGWSDLRELWFLMNKDMVDLLRRIPQSCAGNTVRMGDNESTLAVLADDYVRHLVHHLEQIGCTTLPYQD